MRMLAKMSQGITAVSPVPHPSCYEWALLAQTQEPCRSEVLQKTWVAPGCHPRQRIHPHFIPLSSSWLMGFVCSPVLVLMLTENILQNFLSPIAKSWILFFFFFLVISKERILCLLSINQCFQHQLPEVSLDLSLLFCNFLLQDPCCPPAASVYHTPVLQWHISLESQNHARLYSQT